MPLRASLALVPFMAAGVALAAPKPDAASGRRRYEAQCLICHGRTGAGDGPAGVALNPRPRSFADPAFWSDRSDPAVMTAIQQGRPGTAMKAFPDLTRPDLEALTAYLRSLAPAP